MNRLTIDRDARIVRLDASAPFWLPSLSEWTAAALKLSAIATLAWMLVAYGAARQGSLNIQTAHNAQVCTTLLGDAVDASEGALRETVRARAAVVAFLGAHPRPRAELVVSR